MEALRRILGPRSRRLALDHEDSEAELTGATRLKRKRALPAVLVAAAFAMLVSLAPVTAAPAVAADSCPAGQSCVIVSVVGSQQSTHVVTFAEVQAGDVRANYGLRPTRGAPTGSDLYTGISIRDLLQNDVGIAITSVTFTETTLQGNGPHQLTQADLADPSSAGYPYVDGLMPAIFYTGTADLGYIEPLKPGDDPNFYLQVPAPTPIFLTVHTTGHILKPVVTPSTTKAHAKAAVKFTASFPTPPGTTLKYSWDFGAGPAVVGTTASQSHTYAKSGTYRVVLTVTGADGSTGVSTPITVRVGAAVPPKPGPGTGTSPSPGPTTGPNTGSGARGGATTSPEPSKSQANGNTNGTDATGSSSTGGGSELPRVVGTLISGSPSAITPEKSSAARATAPAATIGGLPEVTWKSLAGVGAALLLGLGVLAETGVLGRVRARMKKGIR